MILVIYHNFKERIQKDYLKSWHPGWSATISLLKEIGKLRFRFHTPEQQKIRFVLGCGRWKIQQLTRKKIVGAIQNPAWCNKLFSGKPGSKMKMEKLIRSGSSKMAMNYFESIMTKSQFRLTISSHNSRTWRSAKGICLNTVSQLQIRVLKVIRLCR